MPITVGGEKSSLNLVLIYQITCDLGLILTCDDYHLGWIQPASSPTSAASLTIAVHFDWS